MSAVLWRERAKVDSVLKSCEYFSCTSLSSSPTRIWCVCAGGNVGRPCPPRNHRACGWEINIEVLPSLDMTLLTLHRFSTAQSQEEENKPSMCSLNPDARGVALQEGAGRGNDSFSDQIFLMYLNVYMMSSLPQKQKFASSQEKLPSMITKKTSPTQKQTENGS